VFIYIYIFSKLYFKFYSHKYGRNISWRWVVIMISFPRYTVYPYIMVTVFQFFNINWFIVFFILF